MYFAAHVEHVYDHRHLLLQGVARKILLQEQGLDRLHRTTRTAWTCGKNKASTCNDERYDWAYGAPGARGGRHLLDATL